MYIAAASESSVREAPAVGRGARQEPAGENTGGSLKIETPAVGLEARQEPAGENKHISHYNSNLQLNVYKEVDQNYIIFNNIHNVLIASIW